MAASALQAELTHETRQRTPQFQLSLSRSQSLGCHPNQNKPRVGTVGEPSASEIRDRKCHVAIGTRILRPWLRTMREGRLDEHFGHEPKRVCLNSGLGVN
jgi:hypothetical protein